MSVASPSGDDFRVFTPPRDDVNVGVAIGGVGGVGVTPGGGGVRVTPGCG